MNGQEMKNICSELMTVADVVYVSTIDEDGFPHIRAMSNLRNREQFPGLTGFFNRHREDFMVFLTTNRPSQKIQHIRNNPNVSLYYCDFAETHGLMLGGKLEVIEDRGIRHILWHDDWIQFYCDGVDGAEYTVLRVIPVFARGWYAGAGKFEFIPGE